MVSVYRAYRNAEIPGLVSVIIAYRAGLSLPVAVKKTAVLLAAAFIAGYLATNRRPPRIITGR